jgi:carbonic anhydrase/acetyltransferase-like protein (isoleucine patch superfamily)
MMDQLKIAIAKRIDKFVQFWAHQVHNTPEKIVERYRARGMRIGQRVLIYSSDLDGLYPEFISIGDDVIITHAVVLVHDDATVMFAGRRRIAPVKIGSRVFVGHHSLILPGVEIGDDCIIGAGAVVTRSVPSGSIVAGNPARPIKTVAEYRKKLETDDSLLDLKVGGLVPTHDEVMKMQELAYRKFRPDLLPPTEGK